MIGLALDAGSSEAGKVFSPLVVEMNRLFAKFCGESYFSVVDFDIVLSLRVSGRIADFGFDGCSRLRRNKRKRQLTMDIGVSRVKWNDISSHDLKVLIVEYVEEAIELCVGRAKNENGDVNELALKRDLKKVFGEFITS